MKTTRFAVVSLVLLAAALCAAQSALALVGYSYFKLLNNSAWVVGSPTQTSVNCNDATHPGYNMLNLATGATMQFYTDQTIAGGQITIINKDGDCGDCKRYNFSVVFY